MRVILKEKRAELYGLNPDAGEKAAQNFLNFFNFDPGTKIGVYSPMENELDTTPLLNHLFDKGYVCALPRVMSGELVFHAWEPSAVLEKGDFGISAPPASSPLIEPDVVVVPLLGFDRRGHRIGYGKGHFDKYLHTHTGTFIGYGFSGQEVKESPSEPHDIPMHYIVTEAEVIMC